MASAIGEIIVEGDIRKRDGVDALIIAATCVVARRAADAARSRRTTIAAGATRQREGIDPFSVSFISVIARINVQIASCSCDTAGGLSAR